MFNLSNMASIKENLFKKSKDSLSNLNQEDEQIEEIVHLSSDPNLNRFSDLYSLLESNRHLNDLLYHLPTLKENYLLLDSFRIKLSKIHTNSFKESNPYKIDETIILNKYSNPLGIGFYHNSTLVSDINAYHEDLVLLISDVFIAEDICKAELSLITEEINYSLQKFYSFNYKIQELDEDKFETIRKKLEILKISFSNTIEKLKMLLLLQESFDSFLENEEEKFKSVEENKDKDFSEFFSRSTQNFEYTGFISEQVISLIIEEVGCSRHVFDEKSINHIFTLEGKTILRLNILLTRIRSLIAEKTMLEAKSLAISISSRD